MSWLLPWRWQSWNLTTGAQEWGWGVDTGHAGGREEGPEAQESQEEQRQGRGQGPLHGLSFSICKWGRGTDLKISFSSSNPNWNLGEG